MPSRWTPPTVLIAKMKDACSDIELISCAQNATYHRPHVTTRGFALYFTLIIRTECRFCHKCDRPRPPRSHHCKVCKYGFNISIHYLKPLLFSGVRCVCLAHGPSLPLGRQLRRAQEHKEFHALLIVPAPPKASHKNLNPIPFWDFVSGPPFVCAAGAHSLLLLLSLFVCSAAMQRQASPCF